MPRYTWIDNDRSRRKAIGRFLLVEAVLEAIGTDKLFIAYIRTLPSCVSGRYNEYNEAGDGRCVAAHVRRVSLGAGTAIKPRYSAVPLTQNEEHSLTHNKGESALKPKWWWDEMREKYVEQWAVSVLKDKLKLTGDEAFDLRLIAEWADDQGIDDIFWQSAVPA